jgi:hypothetical protein
MEDDGLTDEPADEKSRRLATSIAQWMPLGGGLFLILVSAVGLFVVSGHEGVLTACIVVGAGLILVAALGPRFVGPLELGPQGLRAQLSQLTRNVTAAQTRLTPGNTPAEQDIVSQILAEAAQSPRASLLNLAEQIERRVALLLAQTGWMPSPPGLSFAALVDYVETQGYFPRSLTSSLRVFWQIRNSIIHGPSSVNDDEALRAIDMGVSILKMLDGIPHEIHRVYHPGVPIYADAAGSAPRDGVLAVLLESTSPGGTRKERRVYPTTKTDYVRGSWSRGNGT